MSTSAARDAALARAAARLRHTTPRKTADYTPTEQLIEMVSGKSNRRPNHHPHTSEALTNKSNDVPPPKVAPNTKPNAKESTTPACSESAKATHEEVNQAPAQTINESQTETMPETDEEEGVEAVNHEEVGVEHVTNGDTNEDEGLGHVTNSAQGNGKSLTRKGKYIKTTSIYFIYIGMLH